MGHTKIITIRQASDPVFDAQFLCDRLRAELKQSRARRPSERKSRGECCLSGPRVSSAGRGINRIARHSVPEILLAILVDRHSPKVITQIDVDYFDTGFNEEYLETLRVKTDPRPVSQDSDYTIVVDVIDSDGSNPLPHPH